MKIIRYPNHYGPPERQAPSKIVVLAMAEYPIDDMGNARHAADFMLYTGLSVHALVSPHGEVFRLREDWQSVWPEDMLRDYSNSLAMAYLIAGEHDWFSVIERMAHPYLNGNQQFEAGIELARIWTQTHDIESIQRNSDWNQDKVDPGDGFPWLEFQQAI